MRALRGWLVASAVVALGAACVKPPPPAPPPVEAEAEAPAVDWVTASADGSVTVTQSRTASGCEVRARLAGVTDTLWTASTCLADRRELRFVSPDGLSLVTVNPMPVDDGRHVVTAIRVWRSGRELKMLRVNDLLPATSIHLEGGTAFWLAEQGSQYRVRPTEDGVELVLADLTHATVLFTTGTVRRAPLATPVASPPAPDRPGRPGP